MVDGRHKIEIEVTANADKFKKSIKEATATAKSMGSMSARMQKAGLKGHKQLGKIAGALKKSDKQNYRVAIQQEKRLATAIKMRIRDMQRLAQSQRANRLEIEREYQALKKLESTHRKLRVSRQKAGIFTGRERAAKAGSSINKRGGALAGAALMGIGGVVAGAVSALIGAITSQMSEGYAAYNRYGRATAGLMGTGATKGQMEAVRRRGTPLGFSPVESAQLANQVVRQTGQIGATTQAQQMARATSLSTGEAAGFMGLLTRQGQGFGGKAGTGGRRVLVYILALGTASGLDRARLPEFFQSVGQLAQVAGSATAGAVDTTNISRILTAFGRSGQSGLQGARGAAVTQKLDRMIKAPGGGEAGQALIGQAFGFGRPGGTTSYYDMELRKEQGFLGARGVQNLLDVFKETAAQYGGMGSEAQQLALRELSGGSLTLEQLKSVTEVLQSQLGDAEKRKEIISLTQTGQGDSLQKQSLDAMTNGFGDVVSHLASLENRSLSQGQQVADSFVKLQNLFNKLIDDLFPTMVAALDTAVELLGSIDKAVRSFVGGVQTAPTAMTSKSIGSRFSKAQDIVDQTTQAFRAGEITREEYTSRLASAQGELQSVRVNLSQARSRFSSEDTQAYRSRISDISSEISEARSFDRFGGQSGREAIQAFQAAELTEQQRTRLVGQSEQGQYQALFVPGGRLHAQFTEFLEQHSNTHYKTLELVQELARTVEAGQRNNVEGGAATTRLSGSQAQLDTGDPVSRQ